MAGTKEITLSGGQIALVDEADYELVVSFGSWYLNDSGYAVKKIRKDGKVITYRMHRVINNTPHRLQTDHINGNRLDNRRENLRTVSDAMNAWNMTKPKAHTKYDLPRGVTYDYQRDKFVARKVTMKRFNTKEEAIAFAQGD